MHRSVLQNKKYIKFADANTVEVMCIRGASDAVESGHAKAGTYQDRKSGETYLIEFPGLTAGQLDKLASSGASKYHARAIPYTAIVNPHTLEEMGNFVGGRSAGTIMDAVTTYKKALAKQYGKSLKRKDLRKFQKQADGVLAEMGKGENDKALRAAAKLVSGTAKKPQAIQDKAAKVQADVVAAALKRVDELGAVVARGETKGVARELSALVSAGKGTDVATKAGELLTKVKEMEAK